jgi:hypothetical protein
VEARKRLDINLRAMGSSGIVSFGRVIVEGAAARGNVPNKAPKGCPAAGGKGTLGVVPKVKGLVSGADGVFLLRASV